MGISRVKTPLTHVNTDAGRKEEKYLHTLFSSTSEYTPHTLHALSKVLIRGGSRSRPRPKKNHKGEQTTSPSAPHHFLSFTSESFAFYFPLLRFSSHIISLYCPLLTFFTVLISIFFLLSHTFSDACCL